MQARSVNIQNIPFMAALDLHVVLVAPEIAPNAGNVARTCAALGARLHLVRPLGFFLSDRYLKRAGMDYWQQVEWTLHDSWNEFSESFPLQKCWFFTGDGQQRYDQAKYESGAAIVFGSESVGLPKVVLDAAPPERQVRIPMRCGIRSLNLAVAVAVAAYEAARQQGYAGLF